MRMVIVWTVVIIVPFLVLFLLFTLPISAPVFDSIVCISYVDDIA
jgi:hypothetical protein